MKSWRRHYQAEGTKRHRPAACKRTASTGWWHRQRPKSALSDVEACARHQPASLPLHSEFALQIPLAVKGGPPCSWGVSGVDGQVYFSQYFASVKI